MKIVSIANNKGGVGKTTTAQVLACGLKRKRKKVLLVDMDPQTNLTLSAGFTAEDYEDDDLLTIYELFNEPELILEDGAIRRAPIGCDIILGSVQFTGADREYTETGILKEILNPIKNEYDYIVIDTPPTLGILTANALTSSNDVIIPIGAGLFSLQGISQLYGLIERVQESTNEDLNVSGLLITRYNARAKISQAMRESLIDVAKMYGTRVFKSQIRYTIAIEELHYQQADIFEALPRHNVTKDYTAFINEYLRR